MTDVAGADPELDAVAPATPQRLKVWKRDTRYGAPSGLVDARMTSPLRPTSTASPPKQQFG